MTLLSHSDFVFGLTTWKEYLISGDYNCELIQWTPECRPTVTDHEGKGKIMINKQRNK